MAQDGAARARRSSRARVGALLFDAVNERDPLVRRDGRQPGPPTRGATRSVTASSRPPARRGRASSARERPGRRRSKLFDDAGFLDRGGRLRPGALPRPGDVSAPVVIRPRGKTALGEGHYLAAHTLVRPARPSAMLFRLLSSSRGTGKKPPRDPMKKPAGDAENPPVTRSLVKRSPPVTRSLGETKPRPSPPRLPRTPSLL